MDQKTQVLTARFAQTGTVSQSSNDPMFNAFKQKSLNRFLQCDWGDVGSSLRAENDQNANVRLGKYIFPEFIQIPDQTKLLIVDDGELVIIFFASDLTDDQSEEIER